MDTLEAMARGLAARGNRMRVFDWDKAATIIASRRATEASAGLGGDWEWTGGEILSGGKPVPEDDTYVYLASTWAIPELSVMDEAPEPCWCWASEKGWNAKTYWPDSALAILRNGTRQTSPESDQ